MAVSSVLGTEHEITLRGGRIRYRDTGGDGPVAVLVHGLTTNADLWRNVVPGLRAAGLRCLSPDWPLGGHEHPVPEMDLAPPALASLIAEFLEVLDLDDVTMIANDTGGGLTQMCMTRHPARIAQVVLTPSDCFEAFPPARFAYLSWLPFLPGSLWLLARFAASPLAQRLPLALGDVAKHGVPAEIVHSWYGPARRDPAIRADIRRFLRGVDSRYTLEAADALVNFERPVLLVWTHEDKLFPISLAHRLAERLPCAELVAMSDSYTFVPEDQPERLVRETLTFLRAHDVLDATASPRRHAQPGDESHDTA